MLRGRVALGLVVYGWAMLLVDWWLSHAATPEGPDRALAAFRHQVMGRAVMILGAATVLSGIVVALTRRSRAAAAALVLAVAWLAAAAWTWANGLI